MWHIISARYSEGSSKDARYGDFGSYSLLLKISILKIRQYPGIVSIGQHGIDGDVLPAQHGRHDAHPLQGGRLDGRVLGQRRQRVDGDDAAREDDLASRGARARVVAHEVDGELGAVDGGLEVDVAAAQVGPRRQVVDGRAAPREVVARADVDDPRVGDEAVEAAPPRPGGAEHGRLRVVVLDVARDEERRRARRVEARGDGGALVGAPAREGDAVAAPVEALGEVVADPALFLLVCVSVKGPWVLGGGGGVFEMSQQEMCLGHIRTVAPVMTKTFCVEGVVMEPMFSCRNSYIVSEFGSVLNATSAGMVSKKKAFPAGEWGLEYLAFKSLQAERRGTHGSSVSLPISCT